MRFSSLSILFYRCRQFSCDHNQKQSILEDCKASSCITTMLIVPAGDFSFLSNEKGATWKLKRRKCPSIFDVALFLSGQEVWQIRCWTITQLPSNKQHSNLTGNCCRTWLNTLDCRSKLLIQNQNNNALCDPAEGRTSCYHARMCISTFLARTHLTNARHWPFFGRRCHCKAISSLSFGFTNRKSLSTSSADAITLSFTVRASSRSHCILHVFICYVVFHLQPRPPDALSSRLHIVTPARNVRHLVPHFIWHCRSSLNAGSLMPLRHYCRHPFGLISNGK